MVQAARAEGRGFEPVVEGSHALEIELSHGIAHEGALTASDLVDRRTRVGLVSSQRARALRAAEEAFARSGDGRGISSVGG
jgi:glycerol-3-phosphate dehydrogenase